MVDVIFLGVSLFTVAVVMIRKTSAGVAILSLLAGVLLDQLLTSWILTELPEPSTSFGEYLPLAIRLLVTFTPVVASLLAVKVHRHNPALALVTSLALGFLVMYFGLKVVDSLPAVQQLATSGLLSFLAPYQNAILASGAVLAVTEMVASHQQSSALNKKKKRKD